MLVFERRDSEVIEDRETFVSAVLLGQIVRGTVRWLLGPLMAEFGLGSPVGVLLGLASILRLGSPVGVLTHSVSPSVRQI